MDKKSINGISSIASSSVVFIFQSMPTHEELVF